MGEALEEGIKTWWVDGVQGVRTRERHCREIRLKGNPCECGTPDFGRFADRGHGVLGTAHSTSSLISARCIHLMIMKTITHCSRRYDYVGSVDMADREEGEMPVTFYRKKWGGSTAV